MCQGTGLPEAAKGHAGTAGALTAETRQSLGLTLRSIYEGSIDRQPLPDEQVELLLRLRHKERDRRRSGE
ncbi:hypothetical protein [Methylobacterium sp. sgz302541]|uniref:hypothetical protein n=1 Tax=unclassified Methylobacterium TaxID=2615210 RepID=UPI003D34ECBB